MNTIISHFHKLTEQQVSQFSALEPLYREWNEKINVVSRKDIDNLYLHHVLHSLSIAKYISFKDGTSVLDLGTGGGFPGIPLAIMFPNVRFHLVDSINKKLKVVEAVAEALGLQNVSWEHIRAEEIKKMKFDFVITRAVAPSKVLLNWSKKHISDKHMNALPNGIIALKGGNLKAELKELGKGEYHELTPITKYFKDEYFIEKYVVYIQG